MVKLRKRFDIDPRNRRGIRIMAEATLGQIDARITEIDELVFRGRTGQISMTVAQHNVLQQEVAYLVPILARGLSESGAGDYETVHQARESIRQLKLLSALFGRYTELNPESDFEGLGNAIAGSLASGNAPDDLKDHAEAFERLTAILNSVYVPLIEESLARPLKRSFLYRFLRS